MNDYNIWYDVFHLFNLQSQLAFIFTNSLPKNNLHITHLEMHSCVPYYYIELKFFSDVKKLVYNIPETRNLTIFKNLKVLHDGDIFMIDSYTINGLDLIELRISYNHMIDDISFMKNLKILDARYSSLSQECINKLDLIELYVDDCTNIENVSHMKNLKILHARLSCNIDQNGIQGLDLYELHANSRITDISFMKNLKSLCATHNCGIDQNGIRGLDLVQLDITGNDGITDVSFMKKLKYLKR